MRHIGNVSWKDLEEGKAYARKIAWVENKVVVLEKAQDSKRHIIYRGWLNLDIEVKGGEVLMSDEFKAKYCIEGKGFEIKPEFLKKDEPSVETKTGLDAFFST